MFYVTVERSGEDVVYRKAFDDYCAAISFCSQFYRPKTRRSVLSFTTEVVNGEFARSYATLVKPDAIEKGNAFPKERYESAVRNETAFDFDSCYLFLIESEFGVTEADRDAQ